jgi:hypothetical protein
MMNLQKGCGLNFGIFNLYDKRYQFFLFSFILFLAVSFKVFYHPKPSGAIKFVISQNRFPIKTIYQQRNILYTYSSRIDKLDFTKNYRVLTDIHGKNYGFKYNFFIDFYTNFYLKKDTNITFIIYSDDGFVLYIDNKKVAEFIGDRPIAKNEVTLFLKKGKHTFKLSYFQGGGNLGIKAFYKIGNEIHLVGENSSFVKFY